MTYRGHVENGLIVLDEPAELPEGASVTVDLETTDSKTGSELTVARPLSPLLELAGKAVDLPSDASINVDHYLYGHPKRECDVH